MSHGFWLYANETPNWAKEYVFKSSFEAKKGATMTANISADTRYRLYINGHFVCDGPVKGTQYDWAYEQPVLTPYLKEGKNDITVRVLYCPAGTSIALNTFRKGHVALWFDGTIVEDGVERKFVSDNNFTCERVDSINYNYPNFGLLASMPPFESHLGEYKTTEVGCHNQAGVSLDRYTVYGVDSIYPLVPRSIPLLIPNAPKKFSLVKSGKGFVEIDAGEYVTAMIDLKFKGEAEKNVKITYAECYYLEDNEHKDKRDDTNGNIFGSFETAVLTGKDQSFAPFTYRAFRYIRIDTDAENFELDLENSTFAELYYPLDISAKFNCSDEYYNRMWKTSIHTLLCCMHELVVDCPYYEQQQYDMDGELQLLYSHCVSTDTRMIKKVISNMAHSQIPNGMLQANYPSVINQIIADFPIFWIFMLIDYLRRTGDKTFVAEMYGVMQKLLDVYHRRVVDNGLVGRTEYWQFVDWVPGWEYGVPLFGTDELMTMDSLLYAAGLGTAVELSKALGNDGFAAEYQKRKDNVLAAVNKYCYDEQDGLYRTGTETKNYTQHTAVWAVLSGAVTGEKATELMKRTMEKDLPKCSFSMNHFMFRALEKSGVYADYAGEVFTGWKKMLDQGCTTWCENPDSPRSECHGWSGAPIYEFSAIVLGVQPATYGFGKVTVKPDFNVGNLEFANGSVPTPYGTVDVAWEKKDGKVAFEVKTPANSGIELTVVLPGCDTVVTTENTYKAEITL